MPIAASKPAARTSGMPWSPHAGTKCVPIKPFVLAPQMKKLPDSSQKSRERAPVTQTGERNGERIMPRRRLGNGDGRRAEHRQLQVRGILAQGR